MRQDNELDQNNSEADIQFYLRIIWKRRKYIAAFVAVCFIATTITVFVIKKTYEASAVLAPVDNSKLPNLGNLASLASSFGGILGSSSNSNEINTLLNSNTLRAEIITNNNLLPVFFDDKWNEEKKAWKNPSGFARFVKQGILGKTEEELYPSTWDGLRYLEKTLIIKNDTKENTVTIIFRFEDPVLTAKIVDMFVNGLEDHMSNEAKRVSEVNKKYLEAELQKTFDPLLQQKIYNMIAQQIETATLAEAKENFAFKVLDPPKVPDKKVKPKRLLLMVLSIFVSAVFSTFISIVFEMKDELKRRYLNFDRN